MSPHTRQELFDMLATPDRTYLLTTSVCSRMVMGKVRAVEPVGPDLYKVTIETDTGHIILRIKPKE